MPKVHVPTRLLCPIALKRISQLKEEGNIKPTERGIMFNPVITPHGYTCDRKNIEWYLETGFGDPLTRTPFTHTFLQPNESLQNEIKALNLATDFEIYEALQAETSDQIKQLNVEEKCFDKVCDVQENRNQASFLHFAAYAKPEIMQFLLEQGGDPNVIDKSDETPLHYVVRFGVTDDPNEIQRRVQIIRLLLHYGANIDAKNNTGYTALHFATSKNPVILKELLQGGANPNISSQTGLLPYDKFFDRDGKVEQIFLDYEHRIRIAPEQIKALINRCDYLEQTNQVMNQTINSLRETIAKLADKVFQLENQKDKSFENTHSSNARRKLGALY